VKPSVDRMHAAAEAPETSVEDRSRALHAEGRLREAITIVLDAYGPEILGYLTAILRDESEAREVWAQAAASLWRSFARFERRCTFRTFAYTVASNAYRRHLRAAGRRREQALASDLELAAPARTETRPHQRSELRARIAELRARLSKDDNALLILRVDRGFAWNEIALTTFESEAPPDPRLVAQRSAALRKRFERIVERLRRLAHEDGLIAEPAR
jgi:RNA polymerase sigma-70 factor, ECF subfamily